jgi:hypothetical protein
MSTANTTLTSSGPPDTCNQQLPLMPPNPLMRSAQQPRHGLAQGGVATPFRGGRAVHNVFDRSPHSPVTDPTPTRRNSS